MGQEPINSLADAAVAVYRQAATWLPQTVKDLTDEELLTRSSEGRSHLYWIAGHMTHSADIANLMNGSKSVIPDSYDGMFGMGTEPAATAGVYPKIGEIFDVFQKAVDNSIAAMKTVSDADYNKPSDAALPEFMARMSRFELVCGFATHIGYHIGQMVTILRKLDKKPWPDM
ncbi:MAG: DinB family protein [Candidatus Zixiibacteriota bacterium]